MLDALMFEERGVPGIAIVTEPFRQTGKAMATTWGLPGFQFLAMPHPIANLAEAERTEQADRLVSAIAKLLTG